jgi:predicted Zn-dependent protease with MMP-like domain
MADLPSIYWLSRARFEELVEEALETIPATLWEAVDNVAVTVEDWPSRQQMAAVALSPGSMLLGLYQGVPLTARSGGYGLVPPDVISIFRGPILRICPRGNETAVRAQVRRTVLHEIAHHFGISDERLEELGAY